LRFQVCNPLIRPGKAWTGRIDKTLIQHDASLRDICRKLLPLLQPAPQPPKRRIGFVSDD